MKTEVYSWRVSADLKTGLEREAHRRKISLSAVLDLAARDWLNNGGSESEAEEEQLRLQNAALECFGAFAGADAHRSENARQTVRQRLRRRHDG
jgi:hypothetical protein